MKIHQENNQIVNDEISNNMRYDADYWIEQLDMAAHPEGGYFVETYRSEQRVDLDAENEDFGGRRDIATSIFYLMQGKDFSAFHRMQSDENWYFHDGAGVLIHQITPDGELITSRLGMDPHEGYFPHITVPAGTWFAAEVTDKLSFGLVSCVVSPGFEYQDFELARQEDLLSEFPQHEDLIKRLSFQ